MCLERVSFFKKNKYENHPSAVQDEENLHLASEEHDAIDSPSKSSFIRIKQDVALVIDAASTTMNGYGMATNALIIALGFPRQWPHLVKPLILTGAGATFAGSLVATTMLMKVDHYPVKKIQFIWRIGGSASIASYFTLRSFLSIANAIGSDFGKNNAPVYIPDWSFWVMVGASSTSGLINVAYHVKKENSPDINRYFNILGIIPDFLINTALTHAYIDKALLFADEFDPAADKQFYRLLGSAAGGVFASLLTLKYPYVGKKMVGLTSAVIMLTNFIQMIAENLFEDQIDEDTRFLSLIILISACIGPVMGLSLRCLYDYFVSPAQSVLEEVQDEHTILDVDQDDDSFNEPQGVSSHAFFADRFSAIDNGELKLDQEPKFSII